jgi:hypothetical protein
MLSGRNAARIARGPAAWKPIASRASGCGTAWRARGVPVRPWGTHRACILLRCRLPRYCPCRRQYQ